MNAWTPQQDGPSLWTWLDASYSGDSINTTASTNAQFGGLPDLGPNGNIGLCLPSNGANGSGYSAPFSAVGSNAVVISGKRAAAFYNHNEIYQVQSTITGTTLSVAMVCTLDAATSTNGRLLSGSLPTSGGNDYATAGTFTICRGSSYNNGLSVCINYMGNYSCWVPIPAYDTPFVLVMTITGTTMNLTVNGGFSTNTQNITSTPFNMSKISWGFSAYNTNENWYGLIGEAMVYLGAFTPAQQSQHEGYLAWGWGLQTASGGVLPTTHASYAAAPTIPGITVFGKAGSLSSTGLAGNRSTSVNLTGQAGAGVFQGLAGSDGTSSNLTVSAPSPGTLSATGQAGSVSASASITGGLGTLGLTGAAGACHTGVSVQATQPGTANFTALQGSVSASKTVSVTSGLGTLGLMGSPGSVQAGVTVSGQAGAITIGGLAGQSSLSFTAYGLAGSAGLTGYAGSRHIYSSVSPSSADTILCQAGPIVLSSLTGSVVLTALTGLISASSG